uniref:Cyclin-like domain-containing protein n=1 Tax=Kalanchoe fedtschenkoi TaxID=63787 RepID=A0A7N0ZVD1_KALFE
MLMGEPYELMSAHCVQLQRFPLKSVVPISSQTRTPEYITFLLLKKIAPFTPTILMPHFANRKQSRQGRGIPVSGMMHDEGEARSVEGSNGVGERLSLFDEEDVEMLIEREADDRDGVGFKGCVGFDSELSDVKSFNWVAVARLDALNWILNVRALFGFQFSTVYLAMTYFDQFISRQSIEDGKYWAVRLLSVACISVAAKMEELKVPVLSDYPVGEFVLEKSVIQRMELLVLSRLEWKMARITPFVYFGYYIGKFSGDSESGLKDQLMIKATQLVMNTLQEMNLMTQRPSTIAAAAILAALDIKLTEKALELKLGLVTSSRSLRNDEILSFYRFMQEIEKRRCKTPELDILSGWPHRLSPAPDDKSFSNNPNAGSKRRLSYTDNDKDHESLSKR